MASYSLKKSEILSSKFAIDALFDKNQSFNAFPLKFIYSQFPAKLPSQAGVKVLFIVPKRKWKKAVDRNLFKRRMREAFRLNKSSLTITTQNNTTFAIGIIYLGNHKTSFNQLCKAMKSALLTISKQ